MNAVALLILIKGGQIDKFTPPESHKAKVALSVFREFVLYEICKIKTGKVVKLDSHYLDDRNQSVKLEKDFCKLFNSDLKAPGILWSNPKAFPRVVINKSLIGKKLSEFKGSTRLLLCESPKSSVVAIDVEGRIIRVGRQEKEFYEDGIEFLNRPSFYEESKAIK
jgi:hypothetical protein